MRLRKKDLVPLVTGVAPNWNVVIAPSEAGILTTKVGEQDDTVMWDSQEVKWFSEILRELRGSGTAEPLWKLSYADLVLVWRRACEELKLVNYVQYQLGHGGPLHDQALQPRSLESIQKRRRWKQLKSVTSYEKSGRVAQEAMRFSLRMRRHATGFRKQMKIVLIGASRLPDLPGVHSPTPNEVTAG